jgi:hypothetical protein
MKLDWYFLRSLRILDIHRARFQMKCDGSDGLI